VTPRRPDRFALLPLHDAGLAGIGGGAIVSIVSARSWAAGARRLRRAEGGAWPVTNSLRTELAGQGALVADVHVGYAGTGLAVPTPPGAWSP
jgi:hypothetical protein